VASSHGSTVETNFHPRNPKHLPWRLRHIRGSYVYRYTVATILADSAGACNDRLDSGRVFAMGVSDLWLL